MSLPPPFFDYSTKQKRQNGGAREKHQHALNSVVSQLQKMGQEYVASTSTSKKCLNSGLSKEEIRKCLQKIKSFKESL